MLVESNEGTQWEVTEGGYLRNCNLQVSRLSRKRSESLLQSRKVIHNSWCANIYRGKTVSRSRQMWAHITAQHKHAAIYNVGYTHGYRARYWLSSGSVAVAGFATTFPAINNSRGPRISTAKRSSALHNQFHQSHFQFTTTFCELLE